MTFLGKLEPAAYALLRIVAGFLFFFHGSQKLLGFPSPPREAVVFLTQKWFGGVIELLAGALIMFGVFTRPAAFLASGTMAVAYVQFHWDLQLGKWMWLPMVNKGEMAVLYSVIFFFLACRGAGRFSLDGGRW